MNRRKCSKVMGTAAAIALAGLLMAAGSATAATQNLVFGPPYAAFSSAAHGTAEQFTGAGSWSKTYPAPKFEMYIDPVTQFGTSFTIGEIQSITYHTLNGGTNPSGVDFYLLIYTQPYAGGDASWYGNRLNAEPLYSNGYVAPTAGVWNTWSTPAGANQLTFFDANHTANFGFYGGPTLQDLNAGPITWSSYAGAGAGSDATPIDYASQTVKFLNISTGSGWSAFDGHVDAFTINLTNGDSYVIDLESATDPVYVDDDWAGAVLGVEVAPGRFFGFNAFATVQDGVDNVANSTVYVAAGLYEEQVEITADVTIIGAGIGTTIIKSPVSLTAFFTTSSNNYPIVFIHDADNVTIQDLTVDGAGRGNTNVRFMGIGYNNAGGTVDNVEIRDVRDTPFSGAQHGVALYVFNDDGVARSITVSNSDFHGFQKNAMALNAGATTPLAVDVHDNTVTGAGATTITAQNGIQVWADLGTGSITDNTVSGIAYDNTASAIKWVATTILNLYADLSITGNDLSEGHVGIYNIDGAGEISGNTIAIEKIGVYAWGIIASDPPTAKPSAFDSESMAVAATAPRRSLAASVASLITVDVMYNTITFSGPDNTVTFGIEADAGYGPDDIAFTADNNLITGFEVGLELYECQSSCAAGVFTAASASDNSLGGNTIGMRSNLASLTVDGSANWWGSTDPTTVAGQVSGDIDYTPWLGGGTDILPGFEGDFSTLWADDDSPQTGADGPAQEAVNLVTASTVYLMPGTYEEQVEITADMTLIGAGIGTTTIKSPVTLTAFFTTSANNYPIVFIHDADNVTIQDLTVDGAGRGNANYRFMGIGYNNAGGTVDNVEIRDIRDTPFSGSQHGVALYVFNDDGVARSITASNSDFHGFQKNAMALNAGATTPLTVDVNNNTIVGAGATDITAQNGIQVWAALGTGSIANNTVSGIAYDNTASAIKWVATTILNFYADLSIVSNNLSEGHVGVYNIDGSGEISNNHIAIEKIGVYAWGIIASDPPKAVPAGFDDDAMSVSAKRMPGSTMDVKAAAVVSVEVAGNVLSFSGPDNTDTYGIEADAGYGPDDIAFTASNNLVTDFGTGIVIWECQSGCAAGIYTLISVTDNRLSNTSNTYDNSTGGLSFWNHNCYSDLTANAGWPPNYNTDGPAGAIDVDPDVECCFIDDTLPPVITSCPGDLAVVCRADIPACDPGAVVATDDFGPITITCADGPLVGDLCSGTITRTYQAIDSCGNIAECTQVFTIADNAPPTISCPPDITVQQFLDLPPCEASDVTVSDNCGVALVTCERSEVGGIGCADDEVAIVYTYTVFDSCGNSAQCQRTVTVLKPDCPFFVRAGGPDGDMDVLIGQQAVIPVHIDALSIQIGSFDLAMTYNSDAVAILGVDRGEAIEAWEYFTYRLEHNADGSDQIHLIAVADLDNGAMHPPESAYMPIGPIAYLRVAISPDRQFAGESVAFEPYLSECRDNTVVSRMGDMTLVMAQSAFDACAGELTGTVLPGIGFQGARLIIAEPSDAVGDINLNGMAYEVGDAILFTNYLVYGETVLHSDPALRTAQILSSDVNGDGVVLTVGDLIYLIRVLTGDADPLSSSKLSPYAGAGSVSYRVEDGALTVSLSSPLDLGGALMVFRYSGMGVGTPVAAPAASGLTLTSTAGRGELRVLLSTDPTAAMMASVPAGTHDLFTVPVEGGGRIELVETQMSDAQGALMTTFVAGVSIPESFVLRQNYPNPFNAGTVLPFDLKREGDWSLTVYNVAGQVVRTFAGHDAAGRIQVSWDGRDDQGVAASSGVYFYRLTAGDYAVTRKMTLLK